MNQITVLERHNRPITFHVSGQAAAVRRGLLRDAGVAGLPPGRAGRRHVGTPLPPRPRLPPQAPPLPLRRRRPRPRLPRLILAILCKVRERVIHLRRSKNFQDFF